MGRIEYEGPVTQGAHRALKEQIFLIRLHEVLAKARIGKIGNGGICVFMTTFCNVRSKANSFVKHSLTNKLRHVILLSACIPLFRCHFFLVDEILQA